MLARAGMSADAAGIYQHLLSLDHDDGILAFIQNRLDHLPRKP
jgi:hypothetical protein